MGMKRIKTQIAFLAITAIAVLLTAIITASHLGSVFYLPALSVIPIVFLLMKRYSKLKKAESLKKLREAWGKREFKDRNISEVSTYFKETQSLSTNRHVLDDRTWDDLDMDALYSRIDRTLTSPGEGVLYSLLREPLFVKEDLDERNRLITLFLNEVEVREKLQLALLKLGKERGDDLAELLWRDRPPSGKFSGVFLFMVFLIPVFLIFGLLNYGFAWFGLGAAVLANMIIHYRTKERIYENLSSIRHLGRLIRCATRITEIKHAQLTKCHSELERSLSNVSPIAKKTGLLGREGDFVLLEYVNIIFLVEVRAFHSVLKILDNYEEQLRRIYSIIGFMDAMISVASYRMGLDYYAEPEFIHDRSRIQFEGLVHPLITEPVPNSFEVESQGVLITGSNMAGKTTFLKAVAANAVLAQTINTCTAKKYRSSFFKIISLIGRADNVIEGKSYYMDEIQSLLRIIKSINSDVTCLCLLDEIFRGTNSLERVAASAEVLLYLARQNCIVFATTHEHELTELVGSIYLNYHFQERIKNAEGISFDYRILKGPSTSYNAVKLLRHVGYPEEITEETEKRIKSNTGSSA